MAWLSLMISCLSVKGIYLPGQLPGNFQCLLMKSKIVPSSQWIWLVPCCGWCAHVWTEVTWSHCLLPTSARDPFPLPLRNDSTHSASLLQSLSPDEVDPKPGPGLSHQSQLTYTRKKEVFTADKPLRTWGWLVLQHYLVDSDSDSGDSEAAQSRDSLVTP